MTPFVLAGAGLIVALVMVIASKTFRYIMLAAFVALVVCLVSFPRARLFAGQVTTSIVSRFESISNPGAVELPGLLESALAGEVDEDLGDADEEVAEVADGDSGSTSDSQERRSLIAGTYGAGAGGVLVNLMADQDCDPIQKLSSILRLAAGAVLSPAENDEGGTESASDMD